MKKHIFQRGSVQCRREFCVDGHVNTLTDEELHQVGDAAEVEWVIDESTPLHVEQSDIHDADPNHDYECPEILSGGSVQLESVGGSELEGEDDK